MSAACHDVRQQQQQQLLQAMIRHQSANTASRTTAIIKLLDFMSDTTLRTAGERSMKTEERDDSSDFQCFLDSAAQTE